MRIENTDWLEWAVLRKSTEQLERAGENESFVVKERTDMPESTGVYE